MDWINDRLPTEADADRDGDVAAKKRPGSDAYVYFHWSFVKPGMIWRRTSHWYAEQTPEPAVPATPPRRFVSISRTILKDGRHTLDAIDDDGVAWCMVLSDDPGQDFWTPLTPLPVRQLLEF